MTRRRCSTGGRAGWPLLAEPSSGARPGPLALGAYQFLLDDAGFMAAHQPDVIVSAGRPGLTRGQLACCAAAPRPPRRARPGPGRWSDPARTATDVAGGGPLRGSAAVRRERLAGRSWQPPTPPAARGSRRDRRDVDGRRRRSASRRLARDLAAALPGGALLWAASSMPVQGPGPAHGAAADLRVLASRGASGIDGLVSSAIGAALAHQAAGGGPAAALLGDLALLHDAPGLMLGPGEPRPDLCLVVVNNDGGGIFSTLEQAAFPDSFERVFGTPHGADLAALAAAAGLPYRRIERPANLAAALAAPGAGLRIAELRTSLRRRRCVRGSMPPPPPPSPPCPEWGRDRLVDADAGVEQGVGHVHDQVGDHDEESGQDDEAEH